MYSIQATEMATNPSNCTTVMLRNHYIVTVNVEKLTQRAIGTYYALLIIIEATLFATLLAVHFKIRKANHPFFGLLFGLVLLCYIFCGYAEAVCQFLFLFGGSAETLNLIYFAYDLTYSAITALCFCCLIELPEICRKLQRKKVQQSRDSMIMNVFERTIATIWAVSYETNRTWSLYLVLVVLSVTGYVYFASFECRGCVVSAVVTVIIILGCIGLYFLNRTLTLRYQKDLCFMGKVSLSMRYQIIENMIVVRKALLPVIILDSMVTLVDSFNSELTTRLEEIDDHKCHSMMTYVPYILLNHVAMILEYSIPLYMMFRRSYRRQLPEICRKLQRKKVQQSRDSMIMNVFGQDLNVVPTQNEYFAKLQNEWK
ncbi:Protein CBG08671 [Caenorhabditis briggsae]|uniref:Protein CBG08671 n=1 Tax=Caenorhabditis briggsae TaxID=6238 RepID=A8X6U5_CAEBR|nr:Protein CBG08671 [Caenorhabditis briggsae]CAP28356.1 Protein CBG08671 [Caenorhabditis briggsae]